MAAIDIGSDAINRSGTRGAADRTRINLNNPANESGIITSVDFYMETAATGVKVGTFYGSGANYTNRAGVTIGNVSAGSKQTFSGLSIACTVGDFEGFYMATGTIETDYSGTRCLVALKTRRT